MDELIKQTRITRVRKDPKKRAKPTQEHKPKVKYDRNEAKREILEELEELENDPGS